MTMHHEPPSLYRRRASPSATATATAVDRLDLELPAGVVAGFIGPNGAGKTTTMAMLLGLVRPTSGDGSVLGEPLDDPRSYLRRVGALIEGPAFYPSLTGRREPRGPRPARRPGRRPRSRPCSSSSVWRTRADDRFGAYSLGMKQRLGIAAALLGDPELLILDEPTNGLDPAGHQRDARADRRASRATAAPSSCRRTCSASSSRSATGCVIIDGGRLLYSGPARELRRGDRARGRAPPRGSGRDGTPGGPGGRPPVRRAAPRATTSSWRSTGATPRALRRVAERCRGRLRDRARRGPRAPTDARIRYLGHARRRSTDDPRLPGRARQLLRRRGARRRRHRGGDRRDRGAAIVLSAGRAGAADLERRLHPERREPERAPAAAPRSSATWPRSRARSCSWCSSACSPSTSRGARSARCCCANPTGCDSWRDGWRPFSRSRPASSPWPSSRRGSRRACRHRGTGIATASWTSTAALGAAVSDYGIVLVWVTGYAVLAMTVAMVVRSLAGRARPSGSSGPDRSSTSSQNAWTSAPKFFPGLLLEAIGQRGTPRVGMTEALVTVAAYTAIAAIVSVVVFKRRDVTTA